MSGALAWQVRKALIKWLFFCLGEGRSRGFYFSFFPDSFPSLRGVVFSPFPFSSLVSLLCPLNSLYILVRSLRIGSTKRQNDWLLGKVHSAECTL